jgi:hypothetical protein
MKVKQSIPHAEIVSTFRKRLQAIQEKSPSALSLSKAPSADEAPLSHEEQDVARMARDWTPDFRDGKNIRVPSKSQPITPEALEALLKRTNEGVFVAAQHTGPTIFEDFGDGWYTPHNGAALAEEAVRDAIATIRHGLERLAPGSDRNNGAFEISEMPRIQALVKKEHDIHRASAVYQFLSGALDPISSDAPERQPDDGQDDTPVR